MANENVDPIFKPILDSINGNASQDTIPTSEGEKTIPEIMDHLMWCSYKANRGYGCSHQGLLSIGIGDEAMRLRYEQESAQIQTTTTDRSDPTIIAECREPWFFWWILNLMREKYPHDLAYMEIESVKEIWETYGCPKIKDHEWIILADRAFKKADEFDQQQMQEIWRQVYRISSLRIT